MTHTWLTVNRRAVLGWCAGMCTVALAGCLGDDSDLRAAAIDDSHTCDNCTMSIQAHPGPVGQAFYPNEQPEDLPDGREDGIARFCSTWCLYTYTLERSAIEGIDPAGAFATDYSAVDYTIDLSGETPTISAHFTADDFASVDALTFVVDSEVEGSMGGALIGFSDASDAEAFQDNHGGERFVDGDISRELIQAL